MDGITKQSLLILCDNLGLVNGTNKGLIIKGSYGSATPMLLMVFTTYFEITLIINHMYTWSLQHSSWPTVKGLYDCFFITNSNVYKVPIFLPTPMLQLISPDG